MGLFMVFFFFFLLLNLSASQTTYEDDNCPKFFECGLLQNLSYPFWGGKQSPTCGHPMFNLTCQESQYPLFNAEQPFRLLNVNFYSQIITIARDDYYFKGICPEEDPPNTALDSLILYYNSSGFRNISIFYNCPAKTIDHFPESNRFNCSTHGREGFFADDSLLKSDDLNNSDLDGCKTRVDVPIQTKVVEGIKNKNGGVFPMDAMLEGLRQGFNVSYGYDCLPCLRLGGTCPYGNNSLPYCVPNGKKRKSLNGKNKVIIGVASVVGGVLLISLAWIIYRRRKRRTYASSSYKFNKENEKDIETFITNHGVLVAKRYSFQEIKKMTNSFKDKLGEGGFGTVYKGQLFDGQLVAVKVPKLSKGNGGEFLNEVASMSRTSHVNVVTLLGYCFDSNKRVLVFEFMPNGSLDKLIPSRTRFAESEMPLTWKKLYEIAIGVARGLEYLHRGCNTRIVHFDIKPHNILLDDGFHAKISDFGLAKLSNSRESIMSRTLEARGTIGYIAPEVFNRNFGNISSKSDVYSYGMLLLDIVGARQRDHNANMDDANGSESSSCYFPNDIYKQVEMERFDLHGSITMEDVEIVKRMTLIGLWCIQIMPSSRPAMSKVIEMLEGSIEALPTPPKPFVFSPPRIPMASSTTSTIEMGQ